MLCCSPKGLSFSCLPESRSGPPALFPRLRAGSQTERQRGWKPPGASWVALSPPSLYSATPVLSRALSCRLFSPCLPSLLLLTCHVCWQTQVHCLGQLGVAVPSPGPRAQRAAWWHVVSVSPEAPRPEARGKEQKVFVLERISLTRQGTRASAGVPLTCHYDSVYPGYILVSQEQKALLKSQKASGPCGRVEL